MTRSLDGDQVENESNGANTPSGGRQSGSFSLNVFDFVSLHISYERVVNTRLLSRLSG